MSLAAARALADFLTGRRVVVLSGAGTSTESGIPDYRGPGTLQRARSPMQYREFVASDDGRRRYWARSLVGWPKLAAARPNRGHLALAELETHGVLAGLITQNVDRLHHAAGSRRVVELHGALAEVVCLDCGGLESRGLLQERLLALNPDFARAAAALPDGDADLDDRHIAGFQIAGCRACAGILKPNVVFFGENVPRAIVDRAWGLLDEAEALLVVGSSLTVFSGFRFVRRAAERALPIAILNQGPTRGDGHATLRLDASIGDVLPQVRLLLDAG